LLFRQSILQFVQVFQLAKKTFQLPLDDVFHAPPSQKTEATSAWFEFHITCPSRQQPGVSSGAALRGVRPERSQREAEADLSTADNFSLTFHRFDADGLRQNVATPVLIPVPQFQI
jgi:hypothetical protein